MAITPNHQTHNESSNLHDPVQAWGGKKENVEAGQRAMLARAQANSEAQQGKYIAGSQPSADGTLFVKGYKY